MRLVAIVIAVSCILFAQQAAACYQPAPQILFKPGQPAKTASLLDALDGDASVEALRSSAEILHEYPSLRVYVWGFADSGECQGSQCDELAERRAEAVLAWL
jgi:outer membrane protein OmpA-like peptidoglycan-associated protein